MFWISILLFSLNAYFFYLILRDLSFTKQSVRRVSGDILEYMQKPPAMWSKAEIPNYKFFQQIIVMLLKLRQSFGCEIRDILQELKFEIRKDLKIQNKIKKIKRELVLQLIIIICVTFIFHLVSCLIILDIKIDYEFFLYFLVWNGLGMGLFFLISYKQEKRSFLYFDDLFCSFYVIKSLFSASRPLNEIVESSKIIQCRTLKINAVLKERALELIQQIKISGHNSKEDWNLLIQQLWDHYQLQLDLFEKKLKVIRSLALMLFALPSYLYSVVNILENLAA